MSATLPKWAVEWGAQAAFSALGSRLFIDFGQNGAVCLTAFAAHRPLILHERRRSDSVRRSCRAPARDTQFRNFSHAWAARRATCLCLEGQGATALAELKRPHFCRINPVMFPKAEGCPITPANAKNAPRPETNRRGVFARQIRLRRSSQDGSTLFFDAVFFRKLLSSCKACANRTHAGLRTPYLTIGGGRGRRAMFDCADFWPHPRPGEMIRLQYDGPANIRSDYVLADDGVTLLCKDYHSNVWRDTWLIRFDPTRGVLEYGDDYPTSGIEKLLLGPIRKTRFQPGKEISWGGKHDVGDVISSQCIIDHSLSRLLPPFKNRGDFGWQMVHFEALDGDTLRFVYSQAWASKQVGARHYMERGFGPVKIEWRKPDGTFWPAITATPQILSPGA